jgi:hypothetical protein
MSKKRQRYQPTPEEKRIVSRLSGMKVPADILRLAFINPATNKPFCKAHFFRLFRKELKHGSFRLKALIANGWYTALENREPWAVKIGLRNNFGMALEGGNMPIPVEDFSSFASDDLIKITLVPGPGRDPIDLNPRPPAPAAANPYAGQPASDAPQIEPPRPRYETPSGAVYEAPRGSIFDRPSGKDWMR